MKVLKLILSTVCTSLIYLLGGWDIALQSLIIAMSIDYLTGVGKSYVAGVLNSNKGFKGIVKKLGILCMVALATIIDQLMNNTGMVRTFIIYYLVANEGLSILENLGAMGIIVPKWLIEKLEQLKEQDGETL